MGSRFFTTMIVLGSGKERLVLVSDEIFQYFTTMCCEITPRIRLEEDSKTTKRGALWYEEYIPSEAIFYGMVWCDYEANRNAQLNGSTMLEQLQSNIVLQMGGNTSVGKGRVCIRLTGGGA